MSKKTLNCVICKCCAFLICMAMVMTGFSMPVRAENTLNGNGTEDSPYQIASESDLNQMISDVNNGTNSDKYYVLTKDIEITAEQTDPIGKGSVHFTGNFDGQNHKITGLKQRMTVDDGDFSGLFGYAENATIKNIAMESVSINNTGSGAYAGGIVGYMNGGALSNCKVISGSVSSGKTAGGIAGYSNKSLNGFENGATVSGSVNAGGIVGEAKDSSVVLKNMKNTGNVNGAKAGGIVGNSGKVDSSNNSGNITGTENAGGIVGSSSNSVANSENTGKIKAPSAGGIAGGESSVSKSSNKGAVESNGYYAAGIAAKGSVTECYNTGTVTNSTSEKAAGISNNGNVTDCYNTGKIRTNRGTSAGISNATSSSYSTKTSYNIGVVSGGTSNYAIGSTNMSYCYYLDNRGTGGSGATSLTSDQMENQDSFTGFNFGVWTMIGIEEYLYPELNSVEMVDIENVVEGFASGKGTAKEPYHIQTTKQLVNMQKDPDAYYVLDNDIEFSSEDFESSGEYYNSGKFVKPLGKENVPFTGSFNGQNHKITGFKQRMTTDDGNYSGLFGYAENATIKNITMQAVSINNMGSSAYAGGIVGYMSSGTLSNCKVLSGSVSSGKTAGGIAGYSNKSLNGFENSATVNGSVNAGGIVGEAKDSSVVLKNMKNTGNVNGAKAGGIVGNSGKVDSSNNSGNITGTENAGGIVGSSSNSVANSENTGKIKAPSAGGIAGGESSVSKSSNKGAVESNGYYAAGIAAKGSVTECYNTGTVTNSTSEKAAGISNNGNVTDCYNTGKISSSRGTSAGISAADSSSYTTKTSYNIGVICGGASNYAIGIRYVTNCYYLDNRGTGVSGATSLTSEQMENQDSFTGFDFTSKWTMEGVKEYLYPELNSVEMVDIENVFEGFASGKGTAKEPYHIQTTKQLVNMQKDPDAYYVLDNDIEFSSEDFESSGEYYNSGKFVKPLGKANAPFTGSFNGQNHKITGFKQRMTTDDGNYSGLFGYAENATIKNITMESVNINNIGSNAYAGGIVGYMNGGALSNCKVISGSVSSGKTAGGIAGYSNKSLNGFENSATVNGSVNAGGIVGEAKDSSVVLKNMKNTGNVNGAKAGGIVGNSGKVDSSNNSGNITGTENAGGIVGSSSNSVANSENTGKIKAPSAGGIAGGESSVSKSSNKGAVESNGYYAAGIAAKGSVTECYNTGTVTNSTSEKAAGISNNGNVTDCYNTGKISSSRGTSAGISAADSSSYTTKTSYNIGVICGGASNYAIGIRYVTNCYYLDNRGTGVSGATSLTSEQMENQDSFTGFDFTSKWTMEGVEEYPFPELSGVEMVSGEIETIAELQKAAEINKMISDLPDTIELGDETAIVAIREKYDAYIERFGDSATANIKNIDKLTDAEETLRILKEEYEIESHDMKNAIVTVEDGLYSGSPITPVPIVTIFNTVLNKDTDYVVRYEDNIDIGTASVIITGKGEYNNSITKTFKIRKNEDAAYLEQLKDEAVKAKEAAERALQAANKAKEAAEKALAQSNMDKAKAQSDLKKANADKAAAEKKMAAERKILDKIKALNAKIKAKAKPLKKGKVRVTWNKVKNADGYYVYQATKKNGKFKKVKTIKNGKVTKWNSKKLKKKKKYFYKVQVFVTIERAKYSGKESKVCKVKVK